MSQSAVSACFFKYLQEWWFHHIPGQPVPMAHNSFNEYIFPNTQSKPLLVISPCPDTCYLENRLTPSSLQGPFRQLWGVRRSPLNLIISRCTTVHPFTSVVEGDIIRTNALLHGAVCIHHEDLLLLIPTPQYPRASGSKSTSHSTHRATPLTCNISEK